MSTPNFRSCNTSKIFALGMNKYYTQEQIEECNLDDELEGKLDELQTQPDYEYEKANALFQLEEKGWIETDEYDGDRSYHGTYFAEKTRCITVAGVSVEITLKAAVVSGYYEGCTFDVDGSASICDRDGYHVAEYDLYGPYALCEEDVTRDNWTGNNGWSKIHAHTIFSAVRVALAELQTEAEEVFQNCSEYRLGCGGIFSNGSAIYYDLETERGRLKAAVV